MNIKINSVKFEADNKLEEFVKNKVIKLNQYFDDIISAEVFLRVEKPQSVDNKIAEINIKIPGSELFAKKQAGSFEEATDSTVEALRRQLRRYKGKLEDR